MIIAIDGPAASGKGTIARQVAAALGFHYLDSGAVYRLAALAALRSGLSLDDGPALARLAQGVHLEFLPDGRVLLDGTDATEAIREEAVGQAASRVAVHAPLRDSLLQLQRRTCRTPGLVAEGRDMGTVVFPQARLKVFLTASAAARASRRHEQLRAQGQHPDLDTLVEDLRLRDERDAHRPVAPLRPAPGAWVLDSTDLSVSEVVAQVLRRWAQDRDRRPSD